jgi:hypothetical protein
MSYREELKAKFRGIEKRIAQEESDKLNLEVELNRLKLAEFEEDIKESRERQLLKG